MILTFEKSANNCLICSEEDNSCVEMRIGRKIEYNDSINSFTICRSCLAEMKRDIELSFQDLAFWYYVRNNI